MKTSLFQMLVILSFLTVGFMTVTSFFQESGADPSEVIHERHEYWRRCINLPSSPQLLFIQNKVYANGWHEGDHWSSGGNDSVPRHLVSIIRRTVYHLRWVRCEVA